MDREAWRAVIHGVAKSWTRLSDWSHLIWCLIKNLCQEYIKDSYKSVLRGHPNFFLVGKKFEWIFIQEDTWMTNKYIKRCPTWLVIGEMLLKAKMRDHYTSTAQLLNHFWLFATPWTEAHQTPLAMAFSRREYWSGLPFPSPGIFPTQGLNSSHLCLLHWKGDSLPLSHWGNLHSPEKLSCYINLVRTRDLFCHLLENGH